MFEFSLESLHAFQDAADGFVPAEAQEQFGYGINDLLRETSMTVGNYNDILKFRQALSKMKLGQLSETEVPVEEPKRELQPFVAATTSNRYVLAVDFELMFHLMDGSETFGKFLAQVTAIPADATLYIIPMMHNDDVDLFSLFEGTAITNLIRSLPCRKVFVFGSVVGITDLAIASCCDEVEISDYAAVSIVKADNGEFITRYILPVYQHMVNAVYHHWVKRGLFTQEEVDNLFSAESDHSIILLSDEIRRRLQGSGGLSDAFAV